ncbi:MAG: cell envelope-related transcriptional attenuator [Streptosporangiaceae bacterium]|nr:cell envelope-related transcriptional attenuator [Streptosporangiaceae bacterium]
MGRKGAYRRERPQQGGRSLPRALGLTFASAMVWGVAHLATGRRIAGALLMGAFALLVTVIVIAATSFQDDLKIMAVKPDWVTGIMVFAIALGVVWITVVIRSFQITRPSGLAFLPSAGAGALVTVLCAAVVTPFVGVAKYGSTYQDGLTHIFQTGGGSKSVNADDPWNGRRRVNILLLGGDSAYNRVGVRTDSMTVASIDTRTGNTVLLGLPRNLEHFPMPAGPAHQRFPTGFTGDGPQNPGLLNEVFEYAENHPEIVPGVAKGRRGPELLTKTISGILQQPIDYYVLVDMFGFADIVDAMGGVKIKIDQPIPYGRDGGVLQPGYRTLQGKDALWYGRSRTDSDDYARMARQKCLLRAVAKQANPTKVLTQFDKLVSAAKRTISTDIPTALLPALIGLSGKVKKDANIESLSFVPPLIHTGNPDFNEIRTLTARAMADNQRRPSASPSASSPAATAPPGATSPGPDSGGTGSSGTGSSGTDSGGTAAPQTVSGSSSRQAKPVSLDATCPS